VVLEPSQLQRLLRKSFNLGMDPDSRKPRAVNRLEMAKALVGVAEANAIAAKAMAIERAVETGGYYPCRQLEPMGPSSPPTPTRRGDG